MTNTYNIAGTNGSVMVPVLSETGSLMAYILYADPTGILRNHYSCMTVPGAFPDSVQAIPGQTNTNSGSIPCGVPYHKNAFGCTGQPIIHQLKTKTMAKTKSTGGASANRIKNDPAFERTQEKVAEFRRTGKQRSSCALTQ